MSRTSKAKPLKTRVWVIVFALLLLGSAAAWRLVAARPAGSLVGVYEDGRLVRTVDLAAVGEPYEIVLTARGHCVLSVGEGSIYMRSSDCPDQICVLHGPLTNGLPIVCMPNRVMIRYLFGADEGYDAISGAPAMD